ncbi:hypothetical protein E4U43_007062 [Claviceps pusilla]|uniref:Uncharacterized protein n=1 Tax=Claviceps pusilla TaxID=123648 RepID=A0A9P7NGS0_9HYPO|nr:hypothetical protein E4U43_007062 [Claviceps pusilla]
MEHIQVDQLQIGSLESPLTLSSATSNTNVNTEPLRVTTGPSSSFPSMESAQAKSTRLSSSLPTDDLLFQQEHISVGVKAYMGWFARNRSCRSIRLAFRKLESSRH